MKNLKQHQHWRLTTVVALNLLMVGALTSPAAVAHDDWQTAGEHGEIHLYGLLSEGACLLDMQSAYQQVELAAVSTSALAKPGDSSLPTTFQIVLRHCARSGGEQRDRYTNTLSHDAIQPVVTLSFSGDVDPLAPGLLKVSGVQGMGLKLTDPQGRAVVPGESGQPQFLTPGDNILTYRVTPVRTSEKLNAGAYWAVANFKVNYD
ncbi:type 1 fimbrial protein [Enterobacter sp. DRP3]|nr:type 1 fimbrial protein [Enterobacter sp. DRP3]